jgi:hypothetical protein
MEKPAKIRVSLLVGVCLLLLPLHGRSAHIGNSASIAELTRDSDLIVKADAISSVSVADPAFPSFGNDKYPIVTTKFRVISVLKGDDNIKEFNFHHFGIGQSSSGSMVSADSSAIHRKAILRQTRVGDFRRQLRLA